jgi:hypothetical protein
LEQAKEKWKTVDQGILLQQDCLMMIPLIAVIYIPVLEEKAW